MQAYVCLQRQRKFGDSPTHSSEDGAEIGVMWPLAQEPQGSIQKLEETWNAFSPRLPGGRAAVLDFRLLALRILRWKILGM